MHTSETRKKMSESKKGNKNPQWKGKFVGIKPLHRWVRRNQPKPQLCQDCKIKPPYDLANISPKYNPKTYTRDIKNWEWLCRKCHMVKDGRAEKLNPKMLIKLNGKVRSLSEWSKITKISNETIRQRIKKLKWSIKKSLTKSVRKIRFNKNS